MLFRASHLWRGYFFVAMTAFCLTTNDAVAQPVSGMVGIFDWRTFQSGGTLSAYTYDAATDSYYVATFGNFAGLHRVYRNSTGDPWQSGLYAETGTATFPSDIYRFYRSSDVPGGMVDTSYGGTPLLSGILLNPQPVTVTYPQADSAGNVTSTMTTYTYQPGEMAFIADGGTHVTAGSVTHFEWTKKLYRWDLRSIGDPTSAQPDYSTGTSGIPSNPNPGGLFGALNQADWNDVFTVAMTEEAMRTAYTAATGLAPPATSNDNFGRQFAWSSDGQSIYAVDTGTTVGGIYKIAAGSGSTQLIYSEAGSSNLIAEPAVLHTSVRDFQSGFNGDQILFDGTPANLNAGGMSYVVHDGTSTSVPQVLFSEATLTGFSQRTSGQVESITTDSLGNIYFYESTANAIFKYDTEGRFSTVFNKAQLMEMNEFMHESATGQSDRRLIAGGALRLQVREDSTGTYITYRGANAYVGAAKVFEAGDVNRDDAVDQADRDFFIQQFNKTYHGNVPDPFADGNYSNYADYLDYINADVNGDGQARSISSATNSTLPGLTGGGVDLHDLDALGLFEGMELELGDFNWDGAALSSDDWDIFNTHYGMDPADFFTTDGTPYLAFSWFDGDVSGPDGVPDGLVDDFDLNALLAAQLVVPEPSTLLGIVICGLVMLAGRPVLHRIRSAK